MVGLASGLMLSYAEGGDPSGPAVLMLPGPTDSWRSYEPILGLLPSDIRVIAVSQRGHGESGKPERGYRVEDFAADVVPLLDALNVERAVLAGHSGSCLVARRVALDHPDRVSGLLLEASPATLRDDARLLRFVESVVSELGDPISPEFARSFVVDTSSANVAPDLEQVAHRIPRMDPKYLGELERGWHAATLPTAKKIADALDATLAELVTDL